MRFLWIGLACVTACCSGGGVVDAEAAAAARAAIDPGVLLGVLRAAPLQPVPPDPSNAVADDPRAAALGRLLFYDERFSVDGSISCATCHDPESDWGDGRERAEGVSSFAMHTPSLWNVAYNRWYFWDGRADSLWAQAAQPWEHPDEMGGDRVSFARILKEDAELGASYEALFGTLPDVDGWPAAARPAAEDADDPLRAAWDAMTSRARDESTSVLVNMAKAVAAFERLIVTGESPFDRYVSGLRTGDHEELAALGEEELHGMTLFFGEARCHLCHHGPLFSDLEFHDVRLPYELDAAGEDVREFGRWAGIQAVLDDPFNGAGDYSDVGALQPGELTEGMGSARGHLEFLLRSPHTKGEFKTPGLRNVERTAPYTHRGIYSTLEEVIEHYSSLHDAPIKQHSDVEEILVAVELEESEQRALVAFLRSLSSDAAGVELRVAAED